MNDDLAFAEYSALAAFQDQIQRTVESTTSRTRQAGLQPQSFMLLLALRRLTPGMPTTIVQLVETLGWYRTEWSNWSTISCAAASSRASATTPTAGGS